MLLVHSSDLFLLNILLEVRPLDMTPVEQLGDDSWWWYVQLSAIWHWYLPLSIYIFL